MEATQSKCCPNCGSKEFILIGGFVVSHTGIPYKPNMLLKELEGGDYGITRELVRCTACGKKAMLDDCPGAVPPVLWERTDRGTSKPIVCPKCRNTTHFIRNTIRAFRTSEYVKIEGLEYAEVEVGDSQKIDEVMVSFTCNTPECDGEIELSTGDYKLTKG